jgi:FkbM family methyltransferase
MLVRASGPLDKIHLLALRVAGRTGHIKRSATIIRQIFRSSGDVEVTFQPGGHLRIALSDIYWSRILAGWEHEPEVRSVIELARLHQPDAVLLDAGANIGYWGARFAGKVPVIAIEAAPPTYQALRETADRNGFLALNYAVWRESGQELRVTWGFSADPGASVTHKRGDHYASVPTITIDDLYTAHGEGRPLIIKLDVEGAEVAAIDGAAQIANLALWLYEDHGTSVTRRLWDAGLATAHMAHGHVAVFRDLRELEAIKSAAAADRTARPRGVRAYNFVALDPGGPFSSIVGS